MNRKEFLDHILSSGCVLVRTAKGVYAIVRNVVTGEVSGVPVDDPLRPATACRICKTLDIAPPEAAMSAQEIVDLAHRNHKKSKDQK